jgi:hypothetical protein
MALPKRFVRSLMLAGRDAIHYRRISAISIAILSVRLPGVNFCRLSLEFARRRNWAGINAPHVDRFLLFLIEKRALVNEFTFRVRKLIESNQVLSRSPFRRGSREATFHGEFSV